MQEKRQSNKDNLQKGLAFAYRVGDYFENKVGNAIASTPLGAPLLEDGIEPSLNYWYRVMIPEGMTGDGSPYYIFVKKGRSKHLLVFFSGGGVAWNSYTAARPSSGGRITAGLPNYYWNNLRPFTQIMNIHVGITEDVNPRNLFKDWSQVIVTYATGDFHVGRNEFPYTNEDGEEDILHFHGYENFRGALTRAKMLFPDPDQMLIAGDSAGAFAVPALAGEVCDDFYKDCEDVTLLSDSGQLLYAGWHDTANTIWKTKTEIWQSIHSDNITADWYERLYKKYGDRFRYLYATSTHDYLLSAYYNDVANKVYASDGEIQEVYFEQMKVMLKQLKSINPAFCFYLNDFRNRMVMKSGMHGGTTHTNIRSMNFHLPNNEGTSMERWLYDAVSGNLYSSGFDLLQDGNYKV